MTQATQLTFDKDPMTFKLYICIEEEYQPGRRRMVSGPWLVAERDTLHRALLCTAGVAMTAPMPEGAVQAIAKAAAKEIEDAP